MPVSRASIGVTGRRDLCLSCRAVVPPCRRRIMDTYTEKIRVLAVDDNPDTLRVLTALLELAGLEVRSAPSGPVALDTYLDFHPHAVLLDLDMPGMDGFEVCRKVRLIPNSGSVLIVIVTGYLQDEQRVKAIEAGADYYFVKPVEFKKLVALVAQHCASGA